MLGRQPVRVTYAHKKRHVRNASKKLLSSPLEVLAPDVDDLTRTQIARRMLKRSRRVALAEQSEDKNVEHIREHLAKRIKRTQDRVSNPGPTDAPFEGVAQDDFTLQTPFPSLQPVHESAVAKPLVPEQLSPVPVSKRVMSRASSRDLKENTAQSHTLMSPFSSRPCSAAPSPNRESKGRASRRVSRISLRAKSRTLSGVFKENTRRISRKDSTVSLKDVNREASGRRIKHQRCPSTPSIAYMRSRFTREDWITPPGAFSRTFNGRDEVLSPDGSVHSNTLFYVDQPQSCSTPATSRLRKLSDLHWRQSRTGDFFTSVSLRRDSLDFDGSDAEMMDVTVPTRRQTIHLSGDSIFSSSEEFTIGPLATTHDGQTLSKNNDVTDRHEAQARVAHPVSGYHGAADESQAGHSLARSFVAEYDVPVVDPDHSLALTTAFGADGVPKLSVGEQPFGLPGTSPARGDNLVIRTSRKRGISKPCLGEQPFGLPGSSPARGENLARASRNTGALTLPASPPGTTSCPPSSPASDLALELQTMDIRGLDPHSVGGTYLPSVFSAQTCARALQNPLTDTTARKPVKRQPVRNRAGTIRASDHAKPDGLSSGVGPGLPVSPLSNVRRTRSGTVVGPNSGLVAKGVTLGLPSQVAKGAPARLAAVPSGSESDDELLLKGVWTEDLEYLGLAVPRDKNDAEADELNLGDPLHALASGLSRRPRLRRR